MSFYEKFEAYDTATGSWFDSEINALLMFVEVNNFSDK